LRDAGSQPDSSAHARLMDKVYRRQRHIYDFTRKYYLLGRDRLVRELNARPRESVVEIGCGTARNLIHIARRYPGAKLYGLDASAEMLLTAGEALARAGLKDRVLLRHALAEELSPGLFGLSEPFHHAVFSYSLSMIPDWRGSLLAAAHCVRPGGLVHVVDFGDLKGLWPPLSRALRKWLRLFHVAPREELLAALERANLEDGCSLHMLAGRYAFVFRAPPDKIAALLASDRLH
jgi:S-adenosylmethionine-diacylgycerolhomoserine-N-methlytransferase